jgi:hypothetical protein
MTNSSGPAARPQPGAGPGRARPLPWRRSPGHGERSTNEADYWASQVGFGLDGSDVHSIPSLLEDAAGSPWLPSPGSSGPGPGPRPSGSSLTFRRCSNRGPRSTGTDAALTTNASPSRRSTVSRRYGRCCRSIPGSKPVQAEPDRSDASKGTLCGSEAREVAAHHLAEEQQEEQPSGGARESNSTLMAGRAKAGRRISAASAARSPQTSTSTLRPAAACRTPSSLTPTAIAAMARSAQQPAAVAGDRDDAAGQPERRPATPRALCRAPHGRPVPDGAGPARRGPHPPSAPSPAQPASAAGRGPTARPAALDPWPPGVEPPRTLRAGRSPPSAGPPDSS